MECTNCSYNNPDDLESAIINGQIQYLCKRCDDYFIPKTKKKSSPLKITCNILKILRFILLTLFAILLANIIAFIVKASVKISINELFRRMPASIQTFVIVSIISIIIVVIVVSRINEML